MKLLSAGMLLLFGCGAMNATIIFTVGNNPQTGEENVLFNLPGLTAGPATTVTGETQTTNFLVNFTSNENLVTPSDGQARVEGADGDFTLLGINLGTNTFTDIIFNLNTVNAIAGIATISVTEASGPGGSFDLPVAAGSNFLTVTVADSELITGVNISSTTQINDIRQTRISGAGGGSIQSTPEPATLAMTGLGLLGLGIYGRRRRQRRF